MYFVLFYIVCTVLYSLYCFIYFVLFYIVCTVLYTLYCFIYFVLFYIVCTVVELILDICEMKLQISSHTALLLKVHILWIK